LKLFVTGATGFTGSHTIPQLINAGHALKCLYRKESDRSLLGDFELEWVLGDLADREMLSEAMQGCDGLVNMASLGFGHAANIIRAAQEATLKRAIFISTTAIFTSLNAKSKSTRIEAEGLINASGLNFTILRPTMIYGSQRDRNISRLIQMIQKWPLIPVLGNGNFLQQPVYVDDVATAIKDVLGCELTFGKSYNIAGLEPLTYNQMIDHIARLLGKRIRKIHFPAGATVRLLSLMEKTGLRLPIKAEQVLRLNENKDFDIQNAQQDFHYQAHSFIDGIALELQQMRLKI